MPSRRLAAAAAALAVMAAACSSSGSGSGPGRQDPDDLAVAVASYDLAVGPPSRFIAGVLTADQRLLGFGSVDMRFSFLGTRQGQGPGPPGPVLRGTYLPVHGTPVPSPPPAAPQVVSGSEARGVYATEVGFDRAGFWQVEVAAPVGGRTRRATAAFEVADRHRVPAPGAAAPASRNLTLASTDAPRAAIDSRGGSGEIPDPELHSTTVADALAAGRPLVLVISTPVYCTSRFCGPVTDLVADLARDYRDRASFVHIEVWRDFQNQVLNRSAAEWVLVEGAGANEPWVFVVAADGRVAARFDNIATRAEIEPLLQRLPVIGPA